MILNRLRTVAFGLLSALAVCFGVIMTALKAMVVVVPTAVVVMIPGTRVINPNSTEPEPPDTAVLQQELQGWVFNQATEGWITDDYPRSMGPLTGVGDPLFDVSMALGKAALDCLISENLTAGVVGFGYSQGAAVATLWLNDHANGKDQNAPSEEDVSFVLIGSPSRANGGLLARMAGVYVPVIGVPFGIVTPESQYAVTDVVRQYDFAADFPVDPLNIFSVLNVFVDAGAIHGDYLNVDVNDPSNVVEVRGNTTYIMQPAKTLPLADALRSLAATLGRTETPLIDAVEPVLRYLVELGYDRTNQGALTPFQPGSSIARFFNTLPQFAGAVKEGAEIMRQDSQSSIAEVSVVDEVATPSRAIVKPRAVPSAKRRALPATSVSTSVRPSKTSRQTASGLRQASAKPRVGTERANARSHSSTKHSASAGRSARRGHA